MGYRSRIITAPKVEPEVRRLWNALSLERLPAARNNSVCEIYALESYPVNVSLLMDR